MFTAKSSTPGFYAPEMLVPNPLYKPNVDVYALGVILFMLLETKSDLEDKYRSTEKAYKYSE
jgi:serine/threonine protein kinase